MVKDTLQLIKRQHPNNKAHFGSKPAKPDSSPCSRSGRALALLLPLCALITLDQFSKWIVLEKFPALASFNAGIAFSIPLPNALMIFVTPILLLIFAFFAKKNMNFENSWTRYSLSFIFAGGLGNLLDRLFHGAVVDFINLGFWPSFNVADSFITVGAFLLLLFHAKILTDGNHH